MWGEATGRTGSSGARDRRIDDGHDDPRHDHEQDVPGPQLIGATDNVKATVTITFSGKHFKPVPSHRFLGASSGDHLLSVAIGSTTKVGVALTAVANGSWQRWRTDPTVARLEQELSRRERPVERLGGRGSPRGSAERGVEGGDDRECPVGSLVLWHRPKDDRADTATPRPRRNSMIVR